MRVGLGPDYGPTTAQKTIGNSSYNALEATFHLNLGKRATLLSGYTFSKSIDDASNLGEQINPFNQSLTRVISSRDMTHNFVTTYTYALPFDQFFRRNRLTERMESFRHKALRYGISRDLVRRFRPISTGDARQRREQ
jgi:hypothetical protein